MAGNDNFCINCLKEVDFRTHKNCILSLDSLLDDDDETDVTAIFREVGNENTAHQQNTSYGSMLPNENWNTKLDSGQSETYLDYLQTETEKNKNIISSSKLSRSPRSSEVQFSGTGKCENTKVNAVFFDPDQTYNDLYPHATYVRYKTFETTIKANSENKITEHQSSSRNISQEEKVIEMLKIKSETTIQHSKKHIDDKKSTTPPLLKTLKSEIQHPKDIKCENIEYSRNLQGPFQASDPETSIKTSNNTQTIFKNSNQEEITTQRVSSPSVLKEEKEVNVVSPETSVQHTKKQSSNKNSPTYRFFVSRNSPNNIEGANIEENKILQSHQARDPEKPLLPHDIYKVPNTTQANYGKNKTDEKTSQKASRLNIETVVQNLSKRTSGFANPETSIQHQPKQTNTSSSIIPQVLETYYPGVESRQSTKYENVKNNSIQHDPYQACHLENPSPYSHVTHMGAKTMETAVSNNNQEKITIRQVSNPNIAQKKIKAPNLIKRNSDLGKPKAIIKHSKEQTIPKYSANPQIKSEAQDLGNPSSESLEVEGIKNTTVFHHSYQTYQQQNPLLLNATYIDPRTSSVQQKNQLSNNMPSNSEKKILDQEYLQSTWEGKVMRVPAKPYNPAPLNLNTRSPRMSGAQDLTIQRSERGGGIKDNIVFRPPYGQENPLLNTPYIVPRTAQATSSSVQQKDEFHKTMPPNNERNIPIHEHQTNWERKVMTIPAKPCNLAPPNIIPQSPRMLGTQDLKIQRSKCAEGGNLGHHIGFPPYKPENLILLNTTYIIPRTAQSLQYPHNLFAPCINVTNPAISMGAKNHPVSYINLQGGANQALNYATQSNETKGSLQKHRERKVHQVNIPKKNSTLVKTENDVNSLQHAERVSMRKAIERSKKPFEESPHQKNKKGKFNQENAAQDLQMKHAARSKLQKDAGRRMQQKNLERSETLKNYVRNTSEICAEKNREEVIEKTLQVKSEGMNVDASVQKVPEERVDIPIFTGEGYKSIEDFINALNNGTLYKRYY